MDELAKIYRVIDRELPYSDREVLLVLDATTGQNAVNQAKEFKAVAEITGIVLTKLDGTARGGVVLAIKNELGIPVKFIGVGEQIDDLQPFNPQAFADGLFQKIEYEEDDELESEKIAENILGGVRHGVDGYSDSAEQVEELPQKEISSSQEAQASENLNSDTDEGGIQELQQAAQIIDEIACDLIDSVIPQEAEAVDEEAEEITEEIEEIEDSAQEIEEAVEEEIEEAEEIEEEKKEEKKEKRGFFGLFNRHS